MTEMVVHVAAEPTHGGLRQECARCGHVFHDMTPHHPRVPADDPGMGVPFWPPGAAVATQHEAVWLRPEGPRVPGEVECGAAS